MIAILKIVRNERNDILSRVRALLPPKTSTELKLIGGTLFVDIKQYIGRRGINWQKLRNTTSINEWLLPEGVTPPKESGIIDFKPKRLPQKLLVKSAQDVILKADVKPKRLCMGLCLDEETEWFTEFAVEHSNEVRILAKENVEEKSEYYLKKYGAALVVCGDAASLERCNVIVAPAVNALGTSAEGAFVFSPAKIKSIMRIESAKVTADKAFGELSQLYGDMRLLSALYEIDNRPIFASTTVNEAVTNFGTLTLQEIANALRRGI